MVGFENIDRNVKLGAGGIREIEFVVQALQLLHGARHAFLQETSTLKALPVLAQLELIPDQEAYALETAYHFLRRVEHRLQIEAEQQTHTLPENSEALHRLVWSLGFSTTGDFNATLRRHMDRVRTIFQRIIETPAAPIESDESLQIFRDEKSATRSLGDLAKGSGGSHVAVRTRQVLRKLRPLLFRWLKVAADPDVTLNQFVRFVEAYGLRSMLFELLVSNPKLLELLVKTFDASRFAGDLLIRRPQLLEDITRRGMLDRNMSVTDHLKQLEALKIKVNALDPIRVYRQTQLLRILLRDVLGLAELNSLLAEHSSLAEACLTFLNRLHGNEESLTIVALGKFGGNELGYGADLDVLFVGDDIRAAQNLIVTMAQPTAEGTIGTLDARLRPDGEKGKSDLFDCGLPKLLRNARATLGSTSSDSRAPGHRSGSKPIHGPGSARLASRRASGMICLRRSKECCSEFAMNVGSTADLLDFKTGTGGIIEAEFLIQALQWRAGIWNPQTMGALEQLTTQGLLQKEEGALMKKHYEYLRSIESVLRRWENKSVSILPSDDTEQEKLAKRMGVDESRGVRSKLSRSTGDDSRDFVAIFEVDTANSNIEVSKFETMTEERNGEMT